MPILGWSDDPGMIIEMITLKDNLRFQARNRTGRKSRQEEDKASEISDGWRGEQGERK
jgi:hypothetical protein